MIEGFKYHTSDYAYVAVYENGVWQQGKLQKKININISALSTGIQYGQQVFEGLKAYRSKEGNIHLFRPLENAKRLRSSSARLLIPLISDEMFLDAVKKVVLKNKALIPSYETKGSLYIRPFVMGIGDVLGVKPSEIYLFMVVVSPVGSYFKDGFTPITLTTTVYDRSAPNGLGSYKAGANYAASLLPKHLAKENGFDDCLYLDPKTHSKLDESGAANVIAITKDLKFVTPHSPTILPSITNNSLQTIASKLLNLEVECRPINIRELSSFIELGACGTAAIITPISKVVDKETVYTFKEFSYLEKMYDLLTSIQYGLIPDPFGWIINLGKQTKLVKK